VASLYSIYEDTSNGLTELEGISYAGLAVSSGAFICSVVFDCIAAKKAIDEHNRKLRLKFFHKFEQEQEKVGLGLSWRF
jgi:hypothetical protein